MVEYKFWNSRNNRTLSYLSQAIANYSPDNPSKRDKLAIRLFGVNGEMKAKTEGRVREINTIASYDGLTPLEVIDYLFKNNLSPSQIEEILNGANEKVFISSPSGRLLPRIPISQDRVKIGPSLKVLNSFK